MYTKFIVKCKKFVLQYFSNTNLLVLKYVIQSLLKENSSLSFQTLTTHMPCKQFITEMFFNALLHYYIIVKTSSRLK